jgi:hypothetical protein
VGKERDPKMKAVHVPMDDDKFDKLNDARKASGKTWEEFLLQLVKKP